MYHPSLVRYVSDITFSLVIHIWQTGNLSVSFKELEEACLLPIHCFFVFLSSNFEKNGRPKRERKNLSGHSRHISRSFKELNSGADNQSGGSLVTP
jgi:hypothetical protein